MGAVNLTSGAIAKIMTGKCTENDLKPVLQVLFLDILPMRCTDGKQWYQAALSDGSFMEFGVINAEIVISNKLQKGDIVQLTNFQLTKLFTTSTDQTLSIILGYNLMLIRSKCDIIGYPTRYPLNESLLAGISKPTIPEEDHANSHHVEEPPTSIQKQDRVDSHLNENIDVNHHVEEPSPSIKNPLTSTQKCSSHSPTQSKKRKVQPSDDAISVFGKDISETGINLTSGAITEIVTGKCTENDLKPVVQLIDVYSGSRPSKDNKQWYLVVLSDGSFWQFGHIADEIFLSKNLQIGSIVQLTKFQLTKSCTTGEIRYIFVCDLTVICSKCDIIGDPTIISRNETHLMEKSVLPISDHDRADPDLNEDGDSHHVEEAAASKQKPSASTRMRSSHSHIRNKKRKLQSNDDKILTVAKYISKILRTMMKKNTEDDDVHACFKKVETVEEDVARMTKMMMDKNKDVLGLQKLETLEENVSKLTRMMMDKNKGDNVVACFDKLEILEENVSELTRMMMEKNKDVGFNKLETLEEDFYKMTKMMMEKNKEDVGACYRKLERLEEDVSKLTRMMMEKNKEDDMGACIEKLDKMGWGAEEPIYEAALLLFLKGADYRKLWLHLKPESCGKWVKNAGSMFGLLD